VLGSYLPQLIPLVVLLCCLRARPPRNAYTVTWGKFATIEAHINLVTPEIRQYPVEVERAPMEGVKHEGMRAAETFSKQAPGMRVVPSDGPEPAELLVGDLIEVDNLIEEDYLIEVDVDLEEEQTDSSGGAALVDACATQLRDEAHGTPQRAPHDVQAELCFL
jgi:hypothetical protein